MSLGKKVYSSTYIHLSMLDRINEEMKDNINICFKFIPKEEKSKINVIRISNDQKEITALSYPSFFKDPFPTLSESWKVDINKGDCRHRDFRESLNPPILHRKELLISSDHPDYDKFCKTTKQAEEIGLFDNSGSIGFKNQWLNKIEEQGYHYDGKQFLPIGNIEVEESDYDTDTKKVERHRTALTRSNFSAPIQALIRFGYLDGSFSIFDYGCGRGDDLHGLKENNIDAEGWDPHFAPDNEIIEADFVNLGFVINVIEDLDERIYALNKSFELAKSVLVVSVMLSNQNTVGKKYRDGFITSRNTFQKYYTPEEFKLFVEKTLNEQVIPVAPGVLFVFKNKNLEEKFHQERSRAKSSILRVVRSSYSKPQKVKRDRKQEKYDLNIELLDNLWLKCLELGREAKPDEVDDLAELLVHFKTIGQAIKFLYEFKDAEQLKEAFIIRKKDLLVFFALEFFKQRQSFQEYEKSFQRDIKYFFGSITEAHKLSKELLYQIADQSKLIEACKTAQSQGLGWMDDDSIQMHSSLVERLPPILRVYIGCGSHLIGDVTSSDLVKIHLNSRKLSLMKFDDFFGNPLPKMFERVKINFQSQQVQVFDYSDPFIPPYLYRKSRYMNEEMSNYPDQIEFEAQLENLELFDFSNYGPEPQMFDRIINEARWQISGFDLIRSKSIPQLDQKCGDNFSYRDFIECGETQKKTGFANIPKQAKTYNAYYALATNLLDPIIEYYGEIVLTYGFCSAELARKIPGRIAPKLDQHASHELNRNGNLICERLGAAVDFLIEDEDMFEVAKWISSSLEFDRIYIYQKNKPIHISFNFNNKKIIYIMKKNQLNKTTPKIYKF